MYDSTNDTMKHIHTVQTLLLELMGRIAFRSSGHDRSKLEEPEKSMYDEFTPKLRDLTYGSDEYKACLKEMGVALKHHYEHNPHHPEFYPEVDHPEAKVLIDFLDNNDVPGVVDNIIRQYAESLRSRVNGMSLLDVIEMVADWKAASMRHADGHMGDSLEINHVRFGISDQLYNLIKNTIKEMDWWYVKEK